MPHFSSRFFLIILSIIGLLVSGIWLTASHPTHAAGNTYYVATNGSDSNPCSQSAPCRTIAKGLTKLSAGDTLYLRGGTYAQKIQSSAQTIPSGISWYNPVTIAAYPNETVSLATSGTVIDLYKPSAPDIQYVIFDGLNIDAENSGNAIFVGGANTHHIRFQNAEVKNGALTGISGGAGATNIEFINLSVHHNGGEPGSTSGRLDHGFYVAVPSMLIEGSDIYDNSGFGIQVYQSGCDNNPNYVRQVMA